MPRAAFCFNRTLPKAAVAGIFFRLTGQNKNTMKKILTLLLFAGAVTVANAQNSRDEARRVILGGGNGSENGGNGRDVILGGGNNGNNYPGNYPQGNNNRQYQIDQVNREYDSKIQSIRNNQYLSYDEKDRAIRQLERDRQARLQQIYNNYGNGYGNGNNNCNNNNRHDNGKHKGWYKKGKNNNSKNGRDRDDD